MRPYKRIDDNLFAATLLASLVFFFAGASFIKTFEDLENHDHSSGSLAMDVTGMSNTTLTAVLLIMLNIGAAVACLLFTTVQMIRAGRARIFRLVATGQPPELPRLQGWHTFLSHRWATGQDQAHTIARMLTLLLPSIKIWLETTTKCTLRAADSRRRRRI